MALKDDILACIRQTVADFHQSDQPPNPDLVKAEQLLYQQIFNLGFMIIDQNPYSAPLDLDLPTIYPVEKGETRRIRRLGVLKDMFSAQHLDETEPIPGGSEFPAFYPNLKSLEDDGVHEEPDPDKSHDDVTKVDKYVHNIIKVLRMRYGIKNRPETSGPDAGKPSEGYILIVYSGGDA
jgi:hypothetical protein